MLETKRVSVLEIFYDFVFEITNSKLDSFDCFFKNFMLEYS